jgi:small subunit ribosomal protein S17
MPLFSKPRNPLGRDKKPEVIHATHKLDRKGITLGSPSYYTGTVVSVKMQKTGVAMVDTWSYHDKYSMHVRKTKKLLFHDENEETQLGDVVQISNAGRKLSARKRFLLEKIVKKNPVMEQHELDTNPEGVVITGRRMTLDRLEKSRGSEHFIKMKK